MNKKTGYKVASFYSLKKSDPEFSFWNQKDEKIESMDSELSDSMLRIIREVSKDPKTTSNRRLLNETQLEKENKNLEKYMKKARIQEIVIEFGVRDQVMKSNSMGNRLSNRIQNALRREESDEIEAPLPTPQENNPWIFNRDDDTQESRDF
jgi:hypothetical protein